MKKSKIAYWAVIFVLFVLFFVQNQEFFMQKKDFVYNLIHIKTLADLEIGWFIAHKTPEIYLIVLFAAAFLTGVALTFIYGLFSKVQYGKRIRLLKKTNDAHIQKIGELESELVSLRGALESELRLMRGASPDPDIDGDVINIGSKNPEPLNFSKK